MPINKNVSYNLMLRDMAFFDIFVNSSGTNVRMLMKMSHLFRWLVSMSEYNLAQILDLGAVMGGLKCR